MFPSSCIAEDGAGIFPRPCADLSCGVPVPLCSAALPGMHQKKAYHAFPAASAQVSRCTFPDHAPRAPGEGCKRAAPAEAPGEAFRYHRTAEEQKVRPVHTPGCRFSRKALPHRRAQPASVAPLPAARKRPARKSLRTCRTSVKKRGSVARLSPGRRSLSPAQAGRCFASCVHALHLLPGSGAAMPASAKTPKPPHRQSTGGSFVPREGRAFQAQKKAPPGRGLIFTWR